MIFRACRCDDEDGCGDCGYTGYQRQCLTCGDWFPCEHAPQSHEHVVEWNCSGCWHTCHVCQAPAGWVALVWLDGPDVLTRYANLQRLCDACHFRLSNEDKIVPGTSRALKDEERTGT